jgi:hypothetical protein
MRKDHVIAVRVHITIGFMLTAFCILASIKARGAEAPKKLVIGNTAAYSTSIIATAKPDATETVEVNFADVILYRAGVTLAIPVGGAAYAREVEKKFESKKPFYLVDSTDEAAPCTVLSFNDGGTRSSFTLPPVGSIDATHSAFVGPLISDDVEGAWVTVFPERAKTPIWLVVRDAGDLSKRKWETFYADPPVTQYRIQTPGISIVEVKIGDPWFECLPYVDCTVYGSVYGFASTGTPDGGNFRAFAFK